MVVQGEDPSERVGTLASATGSVESHGAFADWEHFLPLEPTSTTGSSAAPSLLTNPAPEAMVPTAEDQQGPTGETPGKLSEVASLCYRRCLCGCDLDSILCARQLETAELARALLFRRKTPSWTRVVLRWGHLVSHCNKSVMPLWIAITDYHGLFPDTTEKEPTGGTKRSAPKSNQAENGSRKKASSGKLLASALSFGALLILFLLHICTNAQTAIIRMQACSEWN